MLSKKAVQEYKLIFQKKYGYKLSDGEAKKHANSLVNFLWVLLPKDEYKNENEEKPRGKKITNK